MLVPINISGGEYKHRSKPLSAQHTRNFWPQIQKNEKEKSKYILQSFYGLKLFATKSGSAGRGLFTNQGVLYRVLDTTLYSVASDGTHTSLGTIPGTGRAIFDAIDAEFVTVANGGAFNYDGVLLTQITDPNMALPNSCAALNGKMIYDEGSGQTFWVSDTGDATTLNGLNYAAAEAHSDALKRIAVFKQTAYMMGEETIESWWDSGQGNPPLDRIQGGLIDIGIDAIHSLGKTPDLMFFLGNDRQVHAITGGAAAVETVVSTPDMAYIFQNEYTTTSDAIGWCMQLEDQWFYVITFPTENATWAYPLGGEWFRWGTGLTGRIRANAYAKIYNKHIVEDYASGNLYQLDPITYTDVDETIVRFRETSPIHGGLFKLDGKRLEMNAFELIMETGVGIVSGQGSDPEIMLQWSDDGGETFSSERRGKIGALGQHKKVTWTNLGSFYERILRISISDPVYCSIHSAAADIEACI